MSNDDAARHQADATGSAARTNWAAGLLGYLGCFIGTAAAVLLLGGYLGWIGVALDGLILVAVLLSLVYYLDRP